MVALSRTGDVSHIRTSAQAAIGLQRLTARSGCALIFKRRPAKELDRNAGKKLGQLAIGWRGLIFAGN
jgi:hypothetical protein